jgi:S-adenosylmethionine hydrolase
VAFTGDDLPRIIYIDHFGNAWTGIRASLMQQGSELEMKGRRLGQQRTFSDAAKGEVFWYGNSCGLVEVAANRASAAQMLELRVGDLVRLPVCPGSLAH